ncbi:unnamed protein product, partial [Rotaria magnacalcarata]
TTQFWVQWKRWLGLGSEDGYRDGTIHNEDRTRLELLIPQPSLGPTIAFEMDDRRLRRDVDTTQ